MKRGKKILFIVLFGVLCIGTIYILIKKLTKNEKYVLSDNVKTILELEKISDCSITHLCNYDDFYMYLEIPDVTQSEIDSYIEKVLEDYGQGGLSEEFIKEEFECESVVEYKKSVAESLLEEKKVDILIEKRAEIMDKLIENSEFSINSDQVVEYSVSIVRAYETEASLFNMSMKEYSEEKLKIPYDSLFDQCYEEVHYSQVSGHKL